MPKVIPASAAGYRTGEWMVRQTIRGAQYEDLIHDQHRAYSDRGNRVGPLFPCGVVAIDHWQTTSTTFTAVNDLVGIYGELVDLDSFSPWFRLGRELQDGASTEREFVFEAIVENADLSVTITNLDGTTYSSILLSEAGHDVVRYTFSVPTSASGSGTLASPLVQFGVRVTARVYNGAGGTGTAYVYQGPVIYERMLETTDAAKLPRGY